MNSHMARVTIWRSASPLAEGGRIEVRGSTLVLTSLNPHPALSLEKGEANVAVFI
jgi:fatty acid-binding protein DegV